MELEKEESFGTKKKTQSKKEKMIVDVYAILLVEKKKKKGKSVVTTSKEITEPSPAQEGNFDEVAKTLSIMSETRERVLRYLVRKWQNP